LLEEALCYTKLIENAYKNPNIELKIEELLKQMSKYIQILLLSPSFSLIFVCFELLVFHKFPLFQAHLTTATKHFGLSAARTKSQVSKFTSIKEATGKLRSKAAGKTALIYFDLVTDCKVPRRD